jgi:hypothetical protein
MPDQNTQPIIVNYVLNRAEKRTHFASGGGQFATVPCCRNTGGRGLRPGQLREAAAIAARYAPARGLMDCQACAEVVARQPAWRPNHFPLMASGLH